MERTSRLKKWFDEHYKSVNEFAEALNVSQPHASMLLNGAAGIGPKTQDKLRELKCDIDWLMTGKTKSEYKQQEENSELLLLREQVATLSAENEKLKSILSPEIVKTILYPTKRKTHK